MSALMYLYAYMYMHKWYVWDDMQVAKGSSSEIYIYIRTYLAL